MKRNSMYYFERFIWTTIAILIGALAIRMTPKTIINTPPPEAIPVSVYFEESGFQQPPNVYFLDARKIRQRDTFHPETMRRVGTIIQFVPK